MTTWTNLDHLSGMTTWAGLTAWAIPASLKNHFKNILSLKMILKIFIPQRSLLCPKPNLFRHICYFLVGQITTFDLQWWASHYLKWFLWPNINWSKILNKYIRLNVLTLRNGRSLTLSLGLGRFRYTCLLRSNKNGVGTNLGDMLCLIHLGLENLESVILIMDALGTWPYISHSLALLRISMVVMSPLLMGM